MTGKPVFVVHLGALRSRSLKETKSSGSASCRPGAAILVGDKLRWEVWLGRYDSNRMTESASVGLSVDGNLTESPRTNDRLIVRCSDAHGLERAA